MTLASAKLPIVRSRRRGAAARPPIATQATPCRQDEAEIFIGEGVSAIPPARVESAVSVLSRNILRDGEIILLIQKPSRWYMALSCIWFVTIVALMLCALHLSQTPPAYMRYYVDAGLFVISCRVMWAMVNWMGRLYVLTDQRILRFAGVFTTDIFECPLRKVARTRIAGSFSERLLRIGTIEIIPSEESRMPGTWQMIARPKEAHEQIEAAIRKAKQGGCGGMRMM